MAGKWDVRLLTAAYRRDGPQQQPVIELFGRTRDGKAITVERWGFQPYFYCIEPSKALIENLERDQEVVSVAPVDL